MHILSQKSLIHIVLNNIAHETVGGMPTVAGSMNLTAVASACGYTYVESADGFDPAHCRKNLKYAVLHPPSP